MTVAGYFAVGVMIALLVTMVYFWRAVLCAALFGAVVAFAIAIGPLWFIVLFALLIWLGVFREGV